MKTLKLFLNPTLLLSLTLFSCLGGDKDGSNPTAMRITAEVLNIDRTAGTITTRITSYECDVNNQAIPTVETETLRYAISGRQLIMWSVDSCDASIFHGTSTDIVGSWTQSYLESRVAIPDPYRPATCPVVLPPDPEDSTNAVLLKNMTMTANITNTSMTLTMSGQLCMGDLMAREFAADPRTAGLQTVSQSCAAVTLRDSATGMTFQISGGLRENNMSMSFTIQPANRTCTMVQQLPLPGIVPDCQAIANSQTAFQQCMSGPPASPTLAKLPADFSSPDLILHGLWRGRLIFW